MTTYSVYNYDTRTYDYYEGTGPGGTHAGTPPVVDRGGVGETPEAAAWRVPAGARKVGSGEMPRGRIASFGEVGVSGTRLVVGAALLYLAWRALR